MDTSTKGDSDMDNIDYDWIIATAIERYGEDFTEEQQVAVTMEYLDRWG